MTAAVDPVIAKRKIASSFFGYYPQWQMFLKEISTVRDLSDPEQRRTEHFVKIALAELAYLVSVPPDNVIGLYAGAQSKAPTSTFFRDHLFEYYAQAFEDYYGYSLDINQRAIEAAQSG